VAIRGFLTAGKPAALISAVSARSGLARVPRQAGAADIDRPQDC